MNQTPKLVLVVLLILVAGGFFFATLKAPDNTPTPLEEVVTETISAVATPTSTQSIIGSSVEGREIETYTFGTGETDLLFVGGVHGGYEWNSVLLAYTMIDYFSYDTGSIPTNVTVHIIPNLNPDGLFAATGLSGIFAATDVPNNSMHTSGVGRFNANSVDLNRNFDCKWAPESSWRGATVSAGSHAFSEPEAQSLRDYVNTISPEGVVFWHSKANNVYASECENGVLPETLTLMRTYSDATSYGAVPLFNAYPITGDAEGWLASINIPAITVELGSRTSIEWEQNLAGTEAVLNMYGK
ncbi:MAG: M14 family metallopeptidase [Candidatus Pacebacteria bacterium]|nr:M14 family metallopeptidase [Candidatus Paceibacterota bacterium]